MGRREIFAGNWKMYKTREEAVGLVRGLLEGLKGISREVVVFPPYPYAAEIAAMSRGTVISVGMQNMHFEKEGAFTGEISPLMVKDSGCRYVLIGHSERRHVFGETDDLINRKIRAAFEFGIEPVICVGELLDEREKGQTGQVLSRQIKGAFSGISAEDASRSVIAYEPVWAIGTGKVATPEIADDAHKEVRNLLNDLYGRDIADSMPVLYGGSVKPDNISGLYAMDNIDGVLVGGASLKADSFLEIIKVK